MNFSNELSIWTPFAPAAVFEGLVKKEKVGFLRNSSSLFDFGKRPIYQLYKHEGKIIATYRSQSTELPLYKKALKVMAIATLVLPLIAILSAYIYQKANAIKVDKIQSLRIAIQCEDSVTVKALLKDGLSGKFNRKDEDVWFLTKSGSYLFPVIEQGDLTTLKLMLANATFLKKLRKIEFYEACCLAIRLNKIEIFALLAASSLMQQLPEGEEGDVGDMVFGKMSKRKLFTAIPHVRAGCVDVISSDYLEMCALIRSLCVSVSDTSDEKLRALKYESVPQAAQALYPRDPLYSIVTPDIVAFWVEEYFDLGNRMSNIVGEKGYLAYEEKFLPIFANNFVKSKFFTALPDTKADDFRGEMSMCLEGLCTRLVEQASSILRRKGVMYSVPELNAQVEKDPMFECMMKTSRAEKVKEYLELAMQKNYEAQ